MTANSGLSPSMAVNQAIVPFIGDASPSAAVLRLPLELWWEVYGEYLELEDLIRFRTACKAFWATSTSLMPLLARKQLPQHTSEPFISDGFYAEALLAAHRLNVTSAFDILLPNDSIAVTRSALEIRKPSHEPAPATKTPTMPERTKLPSRSDWIIGSRRMLHDAHVLDRRPWVFGACTLATCKRGTCKACRAMKGYLTPLHKGKARYRGSQIPPSGHPLSDQYSNAIFAADMLFCEQCHADKRPGSRLRPEEYTGGLSLEMIRASGIQLAQFGGKDTPEFRRWRYARDAWLEAQEEWDAEGLGFICPNCDRDHGFIGEYGPKPRRPKVYEAWWSVQLECLKREHALQQQMRADEKAVAAWRKKEQMAEESTRRTSSRAGASLTKKTTAKTMVAGKKRAAPDSAFADGGQTTGGATTMALNKRAKTSSKASGRPGAALNSGAAAAASKSAAQAASRAERAAKRAARKAAIWRNDQPKL